MKRGVWLILNGTFTLTLDCEIAEEKLVDKKFSPGSDLWTEELPQLVFNDEKTQEEYDNFINDILRLFTEPSVNQIFIDAKIGEESEYIFATKTLIIRKIEEYEVDEIIE